MLFVVIALGFIIGEIMHNGFGFDKSGAFYQWYSCSADWD